MVKWYGLFLSVPVPTCSFPVLETVTLYMLCTFQAFVERWHLLLPCNLLPTFPVAMAVSFWHLLCWRLHLLYGQVLWLLSDFVSVCTSPIGKVAPACVMQVFTVGGATPYLLQGLGIDCRTHHEEVLDLVNSSSSPLVHSCIECMCHSRHMWRERKWNFSV